MQFRAPLFWGREGLATCYGRRLANVGEPELWWFRYLRSSLDSSNGSEARCSVPRLRWCRSPQGTACALAVAAGSVDGNRVACAYVGGVIGLRSDLTVTDAARRSRLAFVVAGGDARQPPLFDFAGARARSPTFSRRTAEFDLARNLGYKFERSVFGIIFLSHGGLPL